MNKKLVKRVLRHKRVRAKVSGTASMPRLSVFKSNSHIYAQIIDDQAKKTLCAVSDKTMKSGKKADKAKEVGKEIAKLALAKKVEKVVFDRGGFKYHGRVKAVAEGAREGGLKF